MLKINYKIKKRETLKNIELSKFFGKPVLPKGMMEKMDDDDYFFGQLNLEQLAKFDTPLPKDGMLYLFLNVKTYPYQAKVIYSKEEREAIVDDFNDPFPDLKPDYPLYLSFEEGEGDIEMFGDILPSCKEEYGISDDTIALLSIDTLSAPCFPNLGAIDGFYYFLIKKEDLKKGKFKKTTFLAYGS